MLDLRFLCTLCGRTVSCLLLCILDVLIRGIIALRWGEDLSEIDCEKCENDLMIYVDMVVACLKMQAMFFYAAPLLPNIETNSEKCAVLVNCSLIYEPY